MSTAAAWLVAGGLWIGSLVPGPWLAAVLGTALAAGARAVPRAGVRLAMLVVAAAAVGSGGAGMRLAATSQGTLVELASQGGEATIVATVVSDVRRSRYGGWFLVRVRSVDGAPVRQRAAVRTNAPDRVPLLGTRVRFTATAQPLDDTGFDTYLRRLHVAVQLRPAGVLGTERAPPRVVAHTSQVRRSVRDASTRGLPRDHAALLAGLVTGDTEGLSDSAQEAMLAAGLTHLVAVSGSNVALVLAGAIGLAAVFGLGARGRRRVAAIAVVWFVVLVRAEPSVLRAASMALLVLAAAGMGRGHDTRHTLAVGAMALLLADPLLAGQLGFALSVLATAGVVLVGPHAAQRLRMPRPLATLVGATIGAQVGVAPVLVALEGGMPLGAVPANLIAVPAATVASAVGVAAALVAQVSTPVAGVLAAVARPALAVILWAGHAFADTPAIGMGDLATPAAAAALCAVVLRRRHPRLATAALIGSVLLVVGTPWRAAAPVDTLTLTALDVGQGDALLVEVPAEGAYAAARVLVDAGPDEIEAARLLRSRGIDRLDAVVVSHPHADHTDGLPAVLSRVAAGALLTGPQPPSGLSDPAASATATEMVAGQRGVPILRLAAGHRFRLGAAVVEVLSPPADGSVGDEPNDNSLVLRLTSRDGAILLTGDAEEAAQQRLLRRPDLLRADVLKVPHHGGDTNIDGFLDAVGADTAVIGVGADNDYGHPHPDVLADLAGTRILRTDTSGTVSVAVN